MSNHLAIATITATLQHTLQSAIQADVDGARATTLSPGDIGGSTPESGANIFLYHVVSNPGLQNIDAPPMRSRSNSVKRQSALDLYYIFSFYGNDNELIPQRLLGSAVRTFNDRRLITKEMIRETCESSTLSFLKDSDLADQVQQLSIMPMDLSIEDLSKTWGVFFQAPYVLSIAYKILVVFIEGESSFKRSLPIRDRQLGDMAAPMFGRPTIERVTSQSGQFRPILATSSLLIQGKYLKGERLTQVRIGDFEITPPEASETEIVLPLSLIPPMALQAGVQTLQVVHPTNLSSPMDSTPSSPKGPASNAMPFVLCPTLETVQLASVEGMDDEPREGQLKLHSNVSIRPHQRVSVSLNEWSTQDPASYLLDVESREGYTQDIVVNFQDIKPGDYLVRLIVDNAESQLETDDDPKSDTYQWFIAPKILIT